VRSIANKHSLLSAVAREHRKGVLSDAGRSAAGEFRAAGASGIEGPRVLEIQHYVMSYPADFEDRIIEALEAAIAAHVRVCGPVSVDTYRGLVPKFVKKQYDIKRILDEAQQLAVEAILSRGGALLGRKGSV
jgi:hypothetical protein